MMDKHVFDLDQLLDEANDMIEERIDLEGGNTNEW